SVKIYPKQKTSNILSDFFTKHDKGKKSDQDVREPGNTLTTERRQGQRCLARTFKHRVMARR
ncbi:hypothetical protein L9F63_011436, partial [Diploptera punctata]